MCVVGVDGVGGEEWDGANQFGAHIKTVLVGVVHGGSDCRH